MWTWSKESNQRISEMFKKMFSYEKIPAFDIQGELEMGEYAGPCLLIRSLMNFTAETLSMQGGLLHFFLVD